MQLAIRLVTHISLSGLDIIAKSIREVETRGY